MSVSAIEGVIIEGSGATLLARITGASGDPVTQASVSSISWEVFQAGPPAGSIYPVSSEETPVEFISEGTCVVATAIYDTLQTDSRWTKDDTGYNFAANIPHDKWPVTSIETFPDDGWAYPDVRFVMTSGDVFTVKYQVKLLATLYGKRP